MISNMKTGTAVATTGTDPYLAYSQSVMAAQSQYLSFKNQEWYFGQDATTLPLGSRLAANMAGLRTGWKRWEGGRCTEERMDLVIELVPPTPRSALGDMDKSLWELDNDGNPRDPWQQVSELQLMDSEGTLYTYSTSSMGGRSAIAALSNEYGRIYRQRPGMVPIVELRAESYMHKKWGKLWNPVLKLVDWTDENVLSLETGDAHAQEEPSTEESGIDDGLPPFPGDAPPKVAAPEHLRVRQAAAATDTLAQHAGGPNTYAASKGRVAAQPAPAKRSGARF